MEDLTNVTMGNVAADPQNKQGCTADHFETLRAAWERDNVTHLLKNLGKTGLNQA